MLNLGVRYQLLIPFGEACLRQLVLLLDEHLELDQ